MEIILKDVNKSYGTHHVLKDINLTVQGGRAVGLLGRNGSGKTTMIRSIMKVFGIDSGSISIPTDDLDTIGYLPEERGMYPKKTLLQQMTYFGELKGMSSKDAKEQASQWIDRMELSEYKDKRADTLSKGNQQKIQLAISLIHNPKIVILDEPFSGLDPVNAQLLKDVVREQIEDGKIVFFSSHQMNNVEEFCDDIAILNQGRIVLKGDLNDIKDSYPHDKIEFLGNMDEIYTAMQSQSYEGVETITKTKDSLIVKVVDEKIALELAKKMTDDIEEVEGFRIMKPTLNEIFIDYTKEGK